MLVQKQIIKSKLNSLNLKQKGELLYDMYKEEWEEKPVDILTFINDPYFLGNSLNINGKSMVFPFWIDKLSMIYESPFIKKYFEILLRAPIGSGKSYLTTISLLYEAYLLMLKKNPQNFPTRPALGQGTQITLIIFSLDLGSANQNWGYAKEFIDNSPFFTFFSQKVSDVKYMPDNSFYLHTDKKILLNLGSNTAHQISRAIHSGTFDEADFHKSRTETAKDKYDSLYNRIGSRFPNFEGILWLVTSANAQGSFSDEALVEANKKKNIYIIVPKHQWEIKGEENYPKGRFEVFIGDKVRDPFIITEETKKNITPDMKIEKVPVNLKEVFQNNLIKALRDYMNITTVNTMHFCKSRDNLDKCMTNDNKMLKSGLHREYIEIDFFDPNDTFINHFENIEYFKNPLDKYCYRNLHIDLGRTRDRLAIASSYAYFQNNEYYRQDFKSYSNLQRNIIVEWAIAIQAKPGQQIPYQKIIQALIWLKKDLHYNIKKVTTDQREGGAQFRQDLEIAGFEVAHLSVDMIRDPYETLESLITEKRVILPNNPLFRLEYTELLDDGVKIDHPNVFTNNKRGSKDLSDAISGSVYTSHQAEKIFNPTMLLKEEEMHKSKESYFDKIAKSQQLKNIGNKFNRNFYI